MATYRDFLCLERELQKDITDRFLDEDLRSLLGETNLNQGPRMSIEFGEFQGRYYVSSILHLFDRTSENRPHGPSPQTLIVLEVYESLEESNFCSRYFDHITVSTEKAHRVIDELDNARDPSLRMFWDLVG